MAVYLVRTRANRFYEVFQKAEEWFINFRGTHKKVVALGDNGNLEKGSRVYFTLKAEKVMRTQPITDIYQKL